MPPSKETKAERHRIKVENANLRRGMKFYAAPGDNHKFHISMHQRCKPSIALLRHLMSHIEEMNKPKNQSSLVGLFKQLYGNQQLVYKTNNPFLQVIPKNSK